MSREPFQKPKLTEQKLEYLDKLTDIVRLIEMTDDLKKVMVERMADVCDSIEKDLLLGKGTDKPIGFIKVEHPITKQDMMLFNDKGIIPEGAVILPTHAVKGMYKREWTQGEIPKGKEWNMGQQFYE